MTEDIDGDGKPETAYWTPGQHVFGVITASGANITMPDPGLTGGGDRSGWIAPMASGQVLAVVSDGHVATLHAFVNCQFIATTGTDGQPYQFTLGAGDFGTGQECIGGAKAATRQVVEALAKREADGGWTITQTPVTVSADGKMATNGIAQALPGEYAQNSNEYIEATQSSCMPLALAQTTGQ